MSFGFVCVGSSAVRETIAASYGLLLANSTEVWGCDLRSPSTNWQYELFSFLADPREARGLEFGIEMHNRAFEFITGKRDFFETCGKRLSGSLKYVEPFFVGFGDDIVDCFEPLARLYNRAVAAFNGSMAWNKFTGLKFFKLRQSCAPNS